MNTELLAANSILKRGVRYQLPAPLLFQFFGVRRTGIVIRQLYLGTELRVAALLAGAGITEKTHEEADCYAFMQQHYRLTLRIVALSTLNHRFLFPGQVWLRMNRLKRITAWQLFELYITVLQYSGARTFMTITRLAYQTRVTMRNLGPKEKRS